MERDSIHNSATNNNHSGKQLYISNSIATWIAQQKDYWFAPHRHSVQSMSSSQCSMYTHWVLLVLSDPAVCSVLHSQPPVTVCNAGHMTLCLHCYILQFVYTYQFHLFRFYITASNSYTCAKSVYQKRRMYHCAIDHEPFEWMHKLRCKINSNEKISSYWTNALLSLYTVMLPSRNWSCSVGSQDYKYVRCELL